MKTRLLFFILSLLILDTNGQEPTAKADSLFGVLANQTAPDTNRINTLLDLVGEVRFYDLDKAQELVQEAQLLSVTLKSSDLEGKSLYYASIIYYFKGFLNLAAEQALKGEKIYTEPYNELMLANFYNLLGIYYTELRKDDEALAYLRKSYDLSLSTADTIGVIQSLGNIGNLYGDLGDRDASREYLQLAVEQLNEFDPMATIAANVYVNLATLIDDDPTEKDRLYGLAQEIFETNNNLEGLAQIQLSLATDYYKKEHYLAALPYNQRAVEEFRDIDFKLEEANALYELASTQLALNRNDAALQSIERSIVIAKEYESNEQLLKAYEILTELHAKNGQTAKELAAYKSWSSLKDSVYSVEKAQFVAENEAKFQSEQKELALAEKVAELAEQKLLRNRIMLWAALALLALTIALVWFYFRQKQRQIQHDNEIQFRELEAQTIKEKEELKSNFFANVSHEFRTPLTLIISPLKELLQNGFKGDKTSLFKMMLRNGNRLMELVNQLLDLSKLESGNLEMVQKRADVNTFLKGVAGTFESLAHTRDIAFTIDAPKGKLESLYDQDKLHKIVSNLLSNAFKFTPDEGIVNMKINANNEFLELTISDSGIGIAAKDLPHIFERFYQSNNLQKSDLSGSGIGLALTKELVELHDGEISVTSKVGKGSIFKVTLPILTAPTNIETEQITINQPESAKIEKTKGISEQSNSDLPLLLIVEDNEDVASLISSSLKDEYQILLAANGQIGLNMALEQIPDVVISDVMMPEMNGYELCQHLKTDQRTSHIPIILLTALAEQKDKLQGLETGADAYLYKPFEIGELRIRISNLIELRIQLRQNFSEAISLKAEDLKANSTDQLFISSVNEVLENNYQDEAFGVDILADNIGLSRRQLSRKLKAIFNQTANELIRVYRLGKAHHLLAQRAITPTEVSYQMGFSSPAYFSKCFSDHYGYPPSQATEELPS